MDQTNDVTKDVSDAFKSAYEGKAKVFDVLLKNEKQEIINFANGEKIDWSLVLRGVVETALSCIPYVGGILATLTDVFWSLFSQKKSVDMIGEIKSMINQIVDEKLQMYDEIVSNSRFTATSNFASQFTFSVKTFDKHANTPQAKEYGEQVLEYLRLLLHDIQEGVDMCQKDGYEVCELPTFALYALQHIILLRYVYDTAATWGMLPDYVQKALDDLRLYSQKYWDHVNKVYNENAKKIMWNESKNFKDSVDSWNGKNDFRNKMLDHVFDYAIMWRTLDPIKYPNGVLRDTCHVKFTSLVGDVSAQFDGKDFNDQYQAHQSDYIDQRFKEYDYYRYKGQFKYLTIGIDLPNPDRPDYRIGYISGIQSIYEQPYLTDVTIEGKWQGIDKGGCQLFSCYANTATAIHIESMPNHITYVEFPDTHIKFGSYGRGVENPAQHDYQGNHEYLYSLVGFDYMNGRADQIDYQSLMAMVAGWIPKSLTTTNLIWPTFDTIIDSQKFNYVFQGDFKFVVDEYAPGFHCIILKPGSILDYRVTLAVQKKGLSRRFIEQFNVSLHCKSPEGSTKVRLRSMELQTYDVPKSNDEEIILCGSTYLTDENNHRVKEINTLNIHNTGDNDLYLYAIRFTPILE